VFVCFVFFRVLPFEDAIDAGWKVVLCRDKSVGQWCCARDNAHNQGVGGSHTCNGPLHKHEGREVMCRWCPNLPRVTKGNNLGAMIGENGQLVVDEPVEFEK
jgi:hypothetical protein